MIAAAIGKYLTALGIVMFSEDQPANCFIGFLPTEPEIAVKITPTPSNAPDPKFAYDSEAIQIWVRGTLNPRDGQVLAGRVFDALQGLRAVTLDKGGEDEVRVLSMFAKNGPHHMGQDALGRHEWAMNFDVEVTSPPSAHRISI